MWNIWEMEKTFIFLLLLFSLVRVGTCKCLDWSFTWTTNFFEIWNLCTYLQVVLGCKKLLLCFESLFYVSLLFYVLYIYLYIYRHTHIHRYICMLYILEEIQKVGLSRIFWLRTTKFRSVALTNWAIRPWVQLTLRANFV